MQHIVFDFNNLENDLFHWFEKYPEYFPLGNKYLKKTGNYFETLGNMYVSRMISKYKKCSKKGTFDEEAFFIAGIATMFGKNTKTDHNKGFHILLDLFDETKNIESGHIVLMTVMMMTTSEETTDIFKRMLHEYAMYFKAHPFPPADFIMGCYCNIFNDSKQADEFFERAMDADFAPAYGYYVIFSKSNKLFDRAVKGVDDSLYLEERISTYAKGSFLIDESHLKKEDDLAKLGCKYIEKAAWMNDDLALGMMASFYCDERLSEFIGVKADYEIAYNYACRAAELNNYSGVFIQAKLHLENKIPNANPFHGQILLGKVINAGGEIAIEYAKQHNLDPTKLVDLYIEYLC